MFKSFEEQWNKLREQYPYLPEARYVSGYKFQANGDAWGVNESLQITVALTEVSEVQ